MAQGKVPSLYVQNEDLKRVQENLVNKMNEILDNPLISGIRIAQVSLSSGSNRVPHGLGRPYVGVLITKRSTGAVIYDETPSEPRTFVQLNSSGSCVVDLWVF